MAIAFFEAIDVLQIFLWVQEDHVVIFFLSANFFGSFPNFTISFGLL
jgi:hypothetical protein